MNVGAAPERRSGLSIVWDVVTTPGTAFETLRAQPRWLWAFGVTCALGMIGAALQIPAGEHIATATIARRVATDPSMASMSQAQIESATRFAVLGQRFVWLFYPILVLIACALTAFFLLIGNAIARGTASYAQLFALAANVAIVNFGIGYLVVGVLSTLRGPQEFTSQTDLLKLVPSLAWVAPGAPPKIEDFLGHANPFSIWSLVLLAAGFRTVAGVTPLVANATAGAIVVGSWLLATALVK